jgi:hypothetical protein
MNLLAEYQHTAVLHVLHVGSSNSKDNELFKNHFEGMARFRKTPEGRTEI